MTRDFVLIYHSASQYNLRAQKKKPRPLAEGVGEGSQHLHEGVCAQGLSRRNDLTTTSLQSGSVNSVQNPEAELRDFEAQ